MGGLEGITLSEISQTEKDKYCDIPFMWNQTSKQISERNERSRLAADLENKLVFSSGGGGARWEWGGGMCKLVGLRQATRGMQPIFCTNCKWKITFKHCIKRDKKRQN